MQQGEVIKGGNAEGKEPVFTKAQMEAMLREQALLASKSIEEQVQAKVNEALASRGRTDDGASIVEAVARGLSQANAHSGGVHVKQKGIQGDIPYVMKEEDQLEEVATFTIPQHAHLIWPEEVNGKLHNSPTGGAAYFGFLTSAMEGNNTVVLSAFHTWDRKWVEFIEGHSEFGHKITRQGAAQLSPDAYRMMVMSKWIKAYEKAPPTEVIREINSINLTLPKSEHIPQGNDSTSIRMNIAAYRAKMELQERSADKTYKTAEQAREAALSAASV